MRYITLTPSFHNRSAVESRSVKTFVPGPNPGCGVERVGNVQFFQIVSLSPGVYNSVGRVSGF